MYTFRTFNNREELTDYLNGAVVGNSLAALTYGLHGLTLIVNDGSADRTVTFADASGAGLSPAAILAQVRAAHANLANVVLRNYGHSAKEPALVIFKDGYTVKVGTANAILGWPGTNAVITEVSNTNIVMLSASYDVGPRYEVVIHS
jgi:hypothetical protein